MAGGRRRPQALVIALALALCLSGCAPAATPPDAGPTTRPAVATPPPPDCTTSVRSGLLPVWARDEFLDGGASFRHVEGLRGEVLGVVFGYPLTSPARPSRQNKILWIARRPATGRLAIEARLEGTGPVVRRDVGFGGGQSVIDLPHAGCWRLALHWGKDLDDVVDLPYTSGR